MGIWRRNKQPVLEAEVETSETQKRSFWKTLGLTTAGLYLYFCASMAVKEAEINEKPNLAVIATQQYAPKKSKEADSLTGVESQERRILDNPFFLKNKIKDEKDLEDYFFNELRGREANLSPGKKNVIITRVVRGLPTFKENIVDPADASYNPESGRHKFHPDYLDITDILWSFKHEEIHSSQGKYTPEEWNKRKGFLDSLEQKMKDARDKKMTILSDIVLLKEGENTDSNKIKELMQQLYYTSGWLSHDSFTSQHDLVERDAYCGSDCYPVKPITTDTQKLPWIVKKNAPMFPPEIRQDPNYVNLVNSLIAGHNDFCDVVKSYYQSPQNHPIKRGQIKVRFADGTWCNLGRSTIRWSVDLPLQVLSYYKDLAKTGSSYSSENEQ